MPPILDVWTISSDSFFVTCYIKVEDGNVRIEPDIRQFAATLGSVDVLTTPDLWPSHKWTVKLIFTIETLVHLIIAASVAWIWVWIRKHNSKSSSPKKRHKIQFSTQN